MVLGSIAACAVAAAGGWRKLRSTHRVGASAVTVAATQTALLYNPFEFAASHRAVTQLEASIPPVCYARTENGANLCWTCHSAGSVANPRVDWDLQQRYAFSQAALRNHWSNVLSPPPSVAASAMTDGQLLAYIREDNYKLLQDSLRAQVTLVQRAQSGQSVQWVPDLDLDQGFDEQGFARDATGWRTLRYAPFVGFGPAAGAAGDVFIRLPTAFRQDANHKDDRGVYAQNLALLEEAMVHGPDEPAPSATHYVGAASDIVLVRYRFPQGAELMHTVRYVDPDARGGFSRRLRELRVLRKVEFFDTWATIRAENTEHEERKEGRPPRYSGDYRVGLRNAYGWQIQAFIEDPSGRLRAQTNQETRSCMGCHGGLGITVDSTFSFVRKLRGNAGWALQQLEGMSLPSMRGHSQREIVEWLERGRVGTFHNHPVFAQWFNSDGTLSPQLAQARDYATVYAAPRSVWLEANRRYLALVRAQSFEFGRDLSGWGPSVHARIESEDTHLADTGRLFRDGVPWLQWCVSC